MPNSTRRLNWALVAVSLSGAKRRGRFATGEPVVKIWCPISRNPEGINWLTSVISGNSARTLAKIDSRLIVDILETGTDRISPMIKSLVLVRINKLALM